MRIEALLIVALAVCLPTALPAQASPAAPAGGVAAPPPAPAETAVALRAGDGIRIVVWRKPELSGDFSIAADGSISSPFYMDVNVAGLPLASAAERVRLHVARYETEPRVLIEPLLRVSVSGEVRQPNLYSLSPETTIVQAIMQAGGPTTFGRLERIVLWRGGEQFTVDLTRPDEGLASASIRSGDQIVVPRRTSILRDYVAPSSSIIGAAVGIANLIIRRRW